MPALRLLPLYLALLLGLGGNLPGRAQNLLSAAHRPVEFMQLTVLESTDHRFAKLLFAPSFQAESQVQLEALDSASDALNEYSYQRNTEKLTKYLGALSAAGWELLEVHAAPFVGGKDVFTTRYLLRRPRP